MVYQNMLFEDTDYPRISVLVREGRTICATDDANNRFGDVYSNGKQGMHLFGHSYFLSSLAVHYGQRTVDDAAREIITHFHDSVLLKAFFSLMFKRGGRTPVFKESRPHYIPALEERFNDLKEILSNRSLTVEQQASRLEDYLNFAAAMQYVLPCNVTYANNSQDGPGGAKVRIAVQNLRTNSRKLQEVIKDTVDPKVVNALFGGGFTPNNNFCVAFIIIQYAELLFLRKPYSPWVHSQNWLNALQGLSAEVYEYTQFKDVGVNQSEFNAAFDNAFAKISDARSKMETVKIALRYY
ncbi:MAG: hypothetical protein LLG04_02725 [Parachlamydia sp.]|nr:hypothetical protein [Parachlamydia sp.]